MRQIRWSQPARDDLRKIAKWLRDEASPATALVYLTAIKAKCRSLQDFPRRGPQVGRDERKLIVNGTPYIILYRLVGSDIQIVRIYHDRADWRRN
jgi:toxin ParE1/3/4